MGLETMEAPVIDRLELKYRAPLHVEIMNQMLGENPTNQEQLDWDRKYAKRISDLIDYHQHDEIRELAIAGEFVEAANLLRELLEDENTD